NLRGAVASTMIGVGGVSQPCTALQHSHPRGRKKTHLRSQLAGLLAAVIEVRSQLAIEEENCFSNGHAVLGSAEAEYVYSPPPGNLGGPAIEARAGIGKSRAIHVQRKPVSLAFIRDRF